MRFEPIEFRAELEKITRVTSLNVNWWSAPKVLNFLASIDSENWRVVMDWTKTRDINN